MTTLTQESNTRLHEADKEGLYPIIEIKLNGRINFEELLFAISQQYKVPYKLLTMDLEYLGKSGFGELLLHLQGTSEENEKAFQYLNQRSIQHAIKGYL